MAPTKEQNLKDLVRFLGRDGGLDIFAASGDTKVAIPNKETPYATISCSLMSSKIPSIGKLYITDNFAVFSTGKLKDQLNMKLTRISKIEKTTIGLVFKSAITIQYCDKEKIFAFKHEKNMKAAFGLLNKCRDASIDREKQENWNPTFNNGESAIAAVQPKSKRGGVFPKFSSPSTAEFLSQDTSSTSIDSLGAPLSLNIPGPSPPEQISTRSLRMPEMRQKMIAFPDTLSPSAADGSIETPPLTPKEKEQAKSPRKHSQAMSQSKPESLFMSSKSSLVPVFLILLAVVLLCFFLTLMFHSSIAAKSAKISYLRRVIMTMNEKKLEAIQQRELEQEKIYRAEQTRLQEQEELTLKAELKKKSTQKKKVSHEKSVSQTKKPSYTPSLYPPDDALSSTVGKVGFWTMIDFYIRSKVSLETYDRIQLAGWKSYDPRVLALIELDPSSTHYRKIMDSLPTLEDPPVCQSLPWRFQENSLPQSLWKDDPATRSFEEKYSLGSDVSMENSDGDVAEVDDDDKEDEHDNDSDLLISMSSASPSPPPSPSPSPIKSPKMKVIGTASQRDLRQANKAYEASGKGWGLQRGRKKQSGFSL